MTQAQAKALLRDESLWVPQQVSCKSLSPTTGYSKENAAFYDKHLKGSIAC